MLLPTTPVESLRLLEAQGKDIWSGPNSLAPWHRLPVRRTVHSHPHHLRTQSCSHRHYPQRAFTTDGLAGNDEPEALACSRDIDRLPG
jgi:hypothetical protein